MQHTEVPRVLDTMKLDHILEHGDKIIYAAIRTYMNEDTRECFPSIDTIAELLQCSRGKITAAIKRLLETTVMQKSIDGRKNHYYFPKSDWDKQFEMFTEAFLRLDMPLNIKEYYMDIQPFLYGKDTGVGKCSFTNTELSRRTGWTTQSIKKYNTWLIEHGFLEEQATEKKDEAGLPIIQKNFNLAGLQQAALWAKAVTQQVVKNTSDIEEIKSENEDLKRRIAALEREAALRRNRIIEKEYIL